jgi:ElaB/YqjD/DUF883 family membrane-anchored ribosome-binding protein
MANEGFGRAQEQVRDIADKAKEISNKVREQWDDTYRDVERSVRRARVAAEESADDARRHIREKPITMVASVAAGAFAIGLVAGFIIGKNRD